MRILDENGAELTQYDPRKGYLKETEILVAHHPAVEGVQEQGHYKVVAEYPNGGKDVEWVVDVPGVEAQEAWDETETVLQYIPFTELELKVQEFERNRQPLTLSEILELLLPGLISTAEVDDATALRMAQFYQEWKPGAVLAAGARVRWSEKLWRVLQPHTSQEGWEPDKVPALFERIDETHAGTLEDPIPYEGNMALVNGLYYYQAGRFFLCTRDTVNPVHHALTELVGVYVEPVE
jgi:hypothetical protein